MKRDLQIYKHKKTGFEVKAEFYEPGKEDFWKHKETGRTSTKKKDDNYEPYMKVHSGGFIVNKKIDQNSIIVYNKKYKFIFDKDTFLKHYDNIK